MTVDYMPKVQSDEVWYFLEIKSWYTYILQRSRSTPEITAKKLTMQFKLSGKDDNYMLPVHRKN
jgi:hypothetical protein